MKDAMIDVPLVDADDCLRTEVARWYCEVFNDPRYFGESWTIESASHYLFDSGADDGDLETRLFAMQREGQVMGAAIACVGRVSCALTVRELPKQARNVEVLVKVRRQVEWFVPDDTVILVFRELGIVPAARNGLGNALNMIVPPIAWAEARGARFGCFWTSRVSPLYRLLHGYGIRDIFDFRDEQQAVFMGDDISTALYRLRQPLKKARRMLLERLGHERFSA
jgi:hypothetical protein